MLEREIKDLKKELVGMEGSLRVTEEKNSKLQHQLSNKVEETKKLHNIINKEQEKGSSKFTLFPAFINPLENRQLTEGRWAIITIWITTHLAF